MVGTDNGSHNIVRHGLPGLNRYVGLLRSPEARGNKSIFSGRSKAFNE